MTVIACKDGVMAADSASWFGDICLSTEAVKLHRLPDGSIAGAAGWKPEITEAIAWLAAGADPKNLPKEPKEISDLDILVFKPDGSVWVLHPNNYRYYQIDSTIAAAGSHHEFVIGAMLSDRSAAETVELACRYCARARGPVVRMALA